MTEPGGSEATMLKASLRPGDNVNPQAEGKENTETKI